LVPMVGGNDVSPPTLHFFIIVFGRWQHLFGDVIFWGFSFGA
jgi:hypothetical protein